MACAWVPYGLTVTQRAALQTAMQDPVVMRKVRQSCNPRNLDPGGYTRISARTCNTISVIIWVVRSAHRHVPLMAACLMHVLCACMCVCVQEYSLSKCWCMQVVSSLHELPSVLKGPLGSSAVGLFVVEYEEQETERVQM